MKKINSLFLILCLSVANLYAQEPKTHSSNDIYQAIEKLNFLGSVLYVAAHPDDENTDLIAYFSNKVNAQTAYLALTRGDGGQNLIGPEIRELLGVIRTQELLAARKIDGGLQFFTRANDFGYSKTPKETFNIWNKKAVLADIVWAIRKFQPDVIINRFNVASAGETHGHHTASAILSEKAFDLANNPEKFPKQLEYVSTWQPKRLYFNTSSWFYNSKKKFKRAVRKGNFLNIDAGVYLPLQGLSNTEISAQSRSQHKSQGFGVAENRGTEMEYLKPVKGHFPEEKTAVFTGINTTWSRLKNGKAIGEILYQVQEDYDFTEPSASVPQLLKAYQLIQKLENDHWRKIKTKAIKEIILAASGLYLESTVATEYAVPGQVATVNFEAINRSATPVVLTRITFPNLQENLVVNKKLKNNLDHRFSTEVQLPKNLAYSTPYWLNKKATTGMYHVEYQKLIGLPETPTKVNAVFELKIGDLALSVKKPVLFKTTSPVEGEVYSPFNIIPKISVALAHDVIIFKDDKPKEIEVRLSTYDSHLKGALSLAVPKNWQVSPASIQINDLAKESTTTYSFKVTPPKNQENIFVRPQFVSQDGTVFDQELIQINYAHIPKQTILLPAKAKLVHLNIETTGKKIAYIEGAGDAVAEGLSQIGYQVTTLSPEKISLENLKKFDAVVIGIRAYNVVKELAKKQPILFDYVEQGGTMIVQYNKNYNLKTKNIAPFPLHLSHDRVTDEYSDVEFLVENHPVLNFPNKITQKDFKGWVQERGLYFPDQWSKAFTPILGMKDQGESQKKSSLLVAKYGKGYYVYTGLSFFREFPAGVAGAFRLFANLVSLGHDKS